MSTDMTPRQQKQIATQERGKQLVQYLTNAVEIYSRFRSVPTNGLFEIWATQQ